MKTIHYFQFIIEEKPLCLNSNFIYDPTGMAGFPLQGQYPAHDGAQKTVQPYIHYASWATMFAIRFGGGQTNGNLLTGFYYPRLLGGLPADRDCDFCSRHIEPTAHDQGSVKYIEIWNEEDQTWTDGFPITLNLLPDATPTFTRTFFYPAQYAAMLSAAYDGRIQNNGGTLQMNGANLGIKNVDGGLNVVFGGTAGLRRKYVADVMTMCKTIRIGAPILPFDVFNFHHYSSSTSQNIGDEEEKHNVAQFFQGVGISPEQDNLRGRLTSLLTGLSSAADGIGALGEYNAKEKWLSEFGYDTENPQSANGSGILVPSNIAGADRQKVQAQWLVRSYLEISAVANGGSYFNKAMVHTLQDPRPKPGVASEQFDFSGLIRGDGTPKRSWFYVLTLKNILKGYTFQGEGGLNVAPAQNPPIRIYRYGQGLNAIYAIWSPTAIGKSFTATITLPNSIPQINDATLYEIKEWDSNGKRTQMTTNGSLTATVSETPIFVKLGEAAVDPITLPVNSLTSQNLCCGAVQLSWNKNQSYKQYVVYYGRKDQLPVPENIGGGLTKFTDFYNTVMTDPHLHFFNTEIAGSAVSALITGLESGVDYWFFVVPYDNNYNTPDFSTAFQGIHYIGGTPGGCTGGANDFCIYSPNANQISACAQNLGNVQSMFGLNDGALSNCGKVSNVPVPVIVDNLNDPALGWNYAVGQNPACNVATLDFTAGGGMAQSIRTIYGRSNGSIGRLLVEYELCACPGFIKAPIITLPIEGESVLTAYNILPTTAIKRLRFTRLDNDTKVQRVFVCSKDAACGPGFDGGTSPPTKVAAEDITPNTALITWDQARMDKNDMSSAPIGSYRISLGQTVDGQGEIVNPTEIYFAAEEGVENQMYRLTGLQPASDYIIRVTPEFNNGLIVPCPSKESSPTVPFTTPGLDDRSSEGKASKPTQAVPEKLGIVPNPNSGTFTVLLPHSGFERVEILDLSGRSLVSKKVHATVVQLKFEHIGLPSGTYLVRAFGNGFAPIEPTLFVIK